jgi:hypothetical protein
VTARPDTWAGLFERAARVAPAADAAAVGEALASRRTGEDGAAATADADATPSEPPEPSPARIVADADVLAADLLVGGPSREALDALRAHGWTTLVASDALLDDAAAVVAALADDGLAADWRARVERWREPVAQPPGDHPALASALGGGAMHVLSLDDRLTGAGGAVAVRDRVETSARRPDAFARLFDPAALFEHVVGGSYPGPDRDPRD